MRNAALSTEKENAKPRIPRRHPNGYLIISRQVPPWYLGKYPRGTQAGTPLAQSGGRDAREPQSPTHGTICVPRVELYVSHAWDRHGSTRGTGMVPCVGQVNSLR